MSQNGNSRQKQMTLIATIITSGVVFLSSSVVNVALPVIGRTLETTLSQLQWVVDGYLLTLSALLILGGALGDRLGRRRMCLVGLTGFGLTMIGAGLAPNTAWLIAMRIIQGISGALMVPESLALIRIVYTDPEQRGRAIGTWSGWTGIATVIGPLVGGAMVDQFSWRWAFFINLPFILLAIWMMIKFVPESRREDYEPGLDWLGAVIVTLALGGVTYGLIEGPVIGWRAPSVLTGLIGGVIAIIAFPLVESRAKNPLLPLTLFRSRNFSGANLTTLAVYAALQGSTFLLVIYIQNLMGYTALQAGLLIAPISLILLLLSSFFGRIANRYGARMFMTFGPITLGLGLVILARLRPDSNIWIELVPGVVLFGLGLAATVAPLTDTVMSAIPDKHSSVGAAFNTMVSRVAGLLAVAAFGAILSLGFTNIINEQIQSESLSATAAQELRDISQDPAAGIDEEQLSSRAVTIYEDAYTTGFRQAMMAGAGLAIFGGVISFITIRKTPKKRDQIDKNNKIR